MKLACCTIKIENPKIPIIFSSCWTLTWIEAIRVASSEKKKKKKPSLSAMDLEEGGLSACGKPSRRLTSWTDFNPGQRFYGCEDYEVWTFCWIIWMGNRAETLLFILLEIWCSWVQIFMLLWPSRSKVVNQVCWGKWESWKLKFKTWSWNWEKWRIYWSLNGKKAVARSFGGWLPYVWHI